MSPFENCATPGSTPYSATPQKQQQQIDQGSNRKGRRKNIRNSRQLSQMTNSAGTVVQNSPAVFPVMDLSVKSPKKRSPGLPKINLTGSPIVIAPDQKFLHDVSSSSPEQDDPESPGQAEHSTFDCTVCKQSVCKLLGNNNNNRRNGNGVGVVVDEEHSIVDSSCHICEYCNMAFPSGQKLKSHLRCHIKPFPCTVCNKSFTNSGNDLLLITPRANELWAKVIFSQGFCPSVQEEVGCRIWEGGEGAGYALIGLVRNQGSNLLSCSFLLTV